MKIRKLSCLFIGLLVLSLAVGCGEDDESSTGPGPVQAPEMGIAEITVPDGLQSVQDPMAQQALQYITAANRFGNWDSFFSPDKKGAGTAFRDGPPWTETWTEDDLTITITITEDATKYYWEIVLDGTDGEYDYDEFLFIESWQTKDGKNGEMVIYDPETEEEIFKWAWATAADGTYTFEMYDFESGEKVVITIDPDGSGTMSFYSYDGAEWILLFSFTWDADGNGSWAEYDEAGTETDSGDWEGGDVDPTDIPDLDFITVNLPEHMLESDDYYALITVAMVQTANALSSFVELYFISQEEAGAKAGAKATAGEDGPPWEYSWTEDGLTTTVTVDESGDLYTWEVVLDGTDGEYTYDEWLAAEAEQAMDGSYGFVMIYELETGEVDVEWSWGTEAGVYQFELIFDGGESEMDITVYADLSGILEQYEGGELFFKSVWASDGTGEWWVYGDDPDSGSWVK
ncbi:MAG: hypothetical protein KAW17_09030 [Candidatus Eisenbacteria sp.]|nr:hypothetical protein [Candidatus Eisenbacteria bacterium]